MAIRFRLAAALFGSLLMGDSAAVRGEPSPASLLNWVFDGEVRSAARLGRTLYVGGTFTRVAPAANALPPVYALSTASGLVTGALPALQGQVVSVLEDGAGGYFLAGNFTTTAPDRRHLVHVTPAGTIDAGFDAQLTSPVRGAVRVGARLFLLGSFSGASGALTPVIAVSAADGAAVAWQAPSLAPILPAAIAAGDDRIVLAGTESIPIVQTGVVVALDATTGGELWRTTVAGGGVGRRGDARAVVREGADVFVAHSGSPVNGGLSKLALASGSADLTWNPQLSPQVLAVAGSTVYAGGEFPAVEGTALTGLAAIDRATGTARRFAALNDRPTHIAPAPSGSVFIGGRFTTVGAVARRRLAEVDATGTPTAWTPDVGPDAVFALLASTPGTLVVSSSVAAFAGTPRRDAAAFDLDSGTLLPWDPALPGSEAVSFVAAGSSGVVITSGIRTRTYDPLTGAAGAEHADLVGLHADSQWFYAVTVNDCCASTTPHRLRRYSLADGTLDRSWQPSLPMPLVPPRTTPPLTMASDQSRIYVAHSGLGAVALDRQTARLLWAQAIQYLTRLGLSGDTLFGVRLGVVSTFEAATGGAIADVPLPVGVGASGLTVADGRLIVSENDVNTFGGSRLAARSFTGADTNWNPAIGRSYFSATPDQLLTVGDVLVAGGPFSTRSPLALHGLAVFALDGARAPAGLRSRPDGPATTLSWVAPVQTPAGGYVVEAGLTAGQTVATIPVGNVTSFTTMVPSGRFHVRVRAIGAAGGADEVSNEIVVTGGCVAPPPPPTHLAAALNGASRDRINFSWTAPEALVTSYTLAVGSAPGLENLGTIALSGSSTGLNYASAVPAGTYFIRLRAQNSCGSSAFTADLPLTIGAGVDLPGPPTGLTAAHVAGVITLSWAPPAGAVTGYRLEAGSDEGLAELAVLSLGPTPSFVLPPVPSGLYVVRVRATNASGAGPSSSELVVRVP